MQDAQKLEARPFSVEGDFLLEAIPACMSSELPQSSGESQTMCTGAIGQMQQLHTNYTVR